MLIHVGVHMALCYTSRYDTLWRQLLGLQQVEVQLYEVWPQLWQLTGARLGSSVSTALWTGGSVPSHITALACQLKIPADIGQNM